VASVEPVASDNSHLLSPWRCQQEENNNQKIIASLAFVSVSARVNMMMMQIRVVPSPGPRPNCSAIGFAINVTRFLHNENAVVEQHKHVCSTS
jgi:hypothetical protein